jgi:hypothetical protein
MTSIFWQMEDDINFLKMEDLLKIMANGRLNIFFLNGR